MGQLPRLVLLPQLVMISTAQPPWLEQLVMCNLHWPLRHVQVVDSKLMVQNAKEPPRPVVPSRFGASITFSILDTSSLCGYMAGQGYFSQDVGREVLRIETIRPFPRKMMFKATNLTMLSIGREGCSPSDPGVCRRAPMFGAQGFHDIFGWASDPSLSEYVGKLSVAVCIVAFPPREQQLQPESLR